MRTKPIKKSDPTAWEKGKNLMRIDFAGFFFSPRPFVPKGSPSQKGWSHYVQRAFWRGESCPRRDKSSSVCC